MRITYLTQWFEPEPNIVKGCAFVRALQSKKGTGRLSWIIDASPWEQPAGD